MSKNQIDTLYAYLMQCSQLLERYESGRQKQNEFYKFRGKIAAIVQLGLNKYRKLHSSLNTLTFPKFIQILGYLPIR